MTAVKADLDAGENRRLNALWRDDGVATGEGNGLWNERSSPADADP